MDASSRLWNFSGQVVSEALEPRRETAIEYKLVVPRFPEQYLEELRLVVSVYHADLASRSPRWAASQAFNSTVVFAAQPQRFEPAVYLPYALAMAVFAVTAVAFRSLIKAHSFKATGGSGGASAADKDDDEPVMNIVPGAQRRRVKAA